MCVCVYMCVCDFRVCGCVVWVGWVDGCVVVLCVDGWVCCVVWVGWMDVLWCGVGVLRLRDDSRRAIAFGSRPFFPLCFDRVGLYLYSKLDN